MALPKIDLGWPEEGYKSLGWANSWTTKDKLPQEFSDCMGKGHVRDNKHQVLRMSDGTAMERCQICKIYWKVDSSG